MADAGIFCKGSELPYIPSENESERYDSRIVSRVALLIKNLMSQLKNTDFDDIDTILILAFLKEVREGCDSNANHEGAASLLTSSFMKKPSLSSLKVRLLPKKSPCHWNAR